MDLELPLAKWLNIQYSIQQIMLNTTMTLSLVELARQLTPFPSLLATRLTGRRVRELLEIHLNRPESGETLMLSLGGVDVMDASFADECFGVLVSDRARKVNLYSPIVLIDLNETCRENLQMALETRPDREPSELERLRNAVLPFIYQGEMHLIGKWEEHVAQSFALLIQYQTLTARDLSDVLNLSLSAASTRLKTLVNLGLAIRLEVRDTQGKQFIYRRLV